MLCPFESARSVCKNYRLADGKTTLSISGHAPTSLRVFLFEWKTLETNAVSDKGSPLSVTVIWLEGAQSTGRYHRNPENETWMSFIGVSWAASWTCLQSKLIAF